MPLVIAMDCPWVLFWGSCHQGLLQTQLEEAGYYGLGEGAGAQISYICHAMLVLVDLHLYCVVLLCAVLCYL